MARQNTVVRHKNKSGPHLALGTGGRFVSVIERVPKPG